MVADKIDVNSRDGFFDPSGALEIAEMMLKASSDAGAAPGNIPVTDIAYQAFRASFAVQDFERTGNMLKLIENAGISLRPAIRQQVEQTREKWNRELMIRRLESSTDDLPRVKFETTAGDIVFELFENHAPQTVGNFISLVEKHLYDDLIFFLVQPGEFAQTGCPVGDGTGDPGYLIPCECDREQIRHHFSGTLSMVNKGPDTGGSQFRIMHQPNGQYDGKSTAFGRVIEGMDVVYQLRRIDKTKKDVINNHEPTKIIKATVLRKRGHEYPFSRISKKPIEQNGIPSLPPSLELDKGSTPGGR
jgi:cyclophilin family peptidyl-prolyl cis-trans isomerase